MHIGIKIPNWGPAAGPDCLLRTARAAEERGFSSVWVSDHLALPAAGVGGGYPYTETSRPPFDATTPFLESLVTLAFVAAATSEVQLGTGVVVLPLRDPVLTAKQAAGLDVLSGGRLLLGVGTGWLPDEFSLVGAPFEERGRRTDAAIDTLRACWDPPLPPLPHDPDHRAVAMFPHPVRGAGLPVLVGGHSAAALRRAARSGDGWYASNVSGQEFGDLVTRLRALDGGAELLVGVRPGVVEPEDAAECVRSARAAGADFVVLDAPYAALGAHGAERWVHRTADRLHLAGSEPLRSRRTWPAGAVAAGEARP